MIGRMRPFYQAHWDISNDIKHVQLLFVHTLHCMVFQWILGGEGRGEWCLYQVHRVDRQCRVWTPQCAASWMLLLYMQEIVPVDSSTRLTVPLWGGGGGGGCRHSGTGLTVPPSGTVWATHRVSCSVTSAVARWYSVWRMTFCTRSIVSIKACVPCS